MQVALPCCIQLCARLWLVLPLQPSAHGSSDVTGSWLAADSRVAQLALEQDFFTPAVALRCIGSQPGRQQVSGRQPLSRTAAAGQRLRQLACFTAIFSCCASTAFLLCNTCKGISRNSRADTLQTTTGAGGAGVALVCFRCGWRQLLGGWIHQSGRAAWPSACPGAYQERREAQVCPTGAPGQGAASCSIRLTKLRSPLA